MIEFPGVLTILQMNHLATFFIASLFFRASSPSSQHAKSSDTPKVTSERFLQNMSLAIGLSQAFKAEVGMNTEHSFPIYNTSTVPFVFPISISNSYDMDFARKLSKKTGIAPQRIFSILVQIIYTLLQFHIKRLFKLDPSEPFIPNSKKYDQGMWEDNPQDWFFILLGAVMPGAIVNEHVCDEPIKFTHILTKPFSFMTNDDKMFGYLMDTNGIPQTFWIRWSEKVPGVPIYSLPTHFLGKDLTPDQPICSAIIVEKGYPPFKEILDHLLQGITFAFASNHAEIEVIVKPTEKIPSVKASRNTLRELFNIPVRTQIVLPKNIEDALQKNSIPKTSCYHPTNVLFDSPELYERMLTLIISYGILVILSNTPDAKISFAANSLGQFIRIFLPDSSVKAFRMEKCAPGTEICTYDPKSLTMWIYKGDLDGNKIGISLKLGKPVILSRIHMGELRLVLFPFSFKIPACINASTPVQKILEAIIKKLVEPIKVVRSNEHITPTIPGSSKGNKATILEQLGKLSFNHNGFQGTLPNGTFPLEKDIPHIGIIYSLDKLSRNHARNVASHFESPKVRTKTYQQSRRISLNVLFEGKVLILFNADKLPLTQDALSKGKTFSLLESEGTNTKHAYYVSCYEEYFIAGEGIEIIYLIPTPKPSPTLFV